MQNIERRRKFFKSFEAKSLRSRSLLTQISDDLTSICGSTPFLIFHIFAISFWIYANLGLVPWVNIFDPFPFGLLTMILSIEAIFLAIFILVSQNRSSFINSLREEVHLRVNLIAEEEVTKVLEVLAEMRKHLGIKKPDPELEEMLKRIDTGYIEHSIIEQIDRANQPLAKKLAQEFPELLLAPIKRPIEAVQNMGRDSAPATVEAKKTS
ncbi:DUF1003 domain-containing protein [Candidatus Daviesbacteria bacterium]|nr:DUF1003 domain-containing protein [Candidatus Daviesbacteria bacterium]